MRWPVWRLRTATVLLAGAFALHQLRYGLLPTPGGAEGHGYLPAALAAAAGLLALAVLQFGRSLLLARRGGGAGAPPPLPLGWASAAGSLLAIHLAQEGVETLASGRPVSSLLAGWWLAALLALALGLLAALLLRGGAAAIARAAARARGPAPRSAPVPPARRRALALALPASPLARHGAGRAPPLLTA